MGFTGFTIILVVALQISLSIGFTSTADNEPAVCHREIGDSFLHLGTRTPYRIIHEQNQQENMPAVSCMAKQIWMLIRHGTRNPSERIIEAMHNILPGLRDRIIGSREKGLLCEFEIDRLSAWSPKTNFSEEKDLVPEGEKELEALGSRMAQKFPGLFQNPQDYKFRHTDTQRTLKSAHSLAKGFLSPEDAQKVHFHKTEEKHDPLLRFYKHCSKWKTDIDDQVETGMRQKLAFVNGSNFSLVRSMVARRLNLLDVTNYQIEMMYQTCAFESAWNGSSPSPWCSVFSKEDLEVLEYSSDLKYYWNDGYGYDINHQQACPLVQDILQHFQNASKESSAAGTKGVFYLTHSGALLKLLAHLGLYKDKEPLWHHNFDQHKSSRLWRVGKIDSFASNLAVVLYNCDSTSKVQFLHQEKPVGLEGCPKEPPFLCPLETLLQLFPDTCDFDQICKLDSKNDLKGEL